MTTWRNTEHWGNLPSPVYWERRYKMIEEVVHDEVEVSQEKLDRLFARAQRETEDKIRSWVQRIAKNNEVSMEEARKLLDSGELEAFRWSVWEYIKRGEENAISQEWMKELENASAQYHIKRYEALLIDLEQIQQELVVEGEKLILNTLEGMYEKAYEMSSDALAIGLSLAYQLSGISKSNLRRAVMEPWGDDARTWSDRIWTHKAQLSRTIEEELITMIITNDSPDKAIKKVQDRFGVTRYQSYRLVQTEAAKVAEDACFDTYELVHVEEYELLAALDSRTSDICQTMHGQHFPVAERKVGTNAPPFHPNCRTTTIPYIDDEIERRWEEK